MESIEDVKSFFESVAEKASASARWNRAAKLIHIGIAFGLAVIALAMVALSSIEPAAIAMIGASSLLAVGMVLWFRRDERKMYIAMAEAESILVHIASGLPFTVTSYSTKIDTVVQRFGKKSDSDENL